ncbi:LysR family transcriptional regulator [Paraburkholderia ginsengisoli]|uniref:LysR family transcriptional regulator n=1 Tax=Paraburkholderia ginsengisoli TaxID=311231 RepID=A0A7T4T956_9BURK|nr:LysR substrate-binding domain-containing protein [Paraburkholderia ginsengisoli]QQC64384.1 LysR family transcriptional regulator [Paraburkholderia ginsengisoli]
MELRHFRYFMAVAEELHFGRAAERLHIEQSPLSRAIKELESDLGVQLFERDRHGTRLTWAGQVFLKDIQRVNLALEQARTNVRSAASGYRGILRIALSDGVAPQRMGALLALCRKEEPEVDIRLFEVSLAQQLKGLRQDLYDAGFARSSKAGEGIIANALWDDPLMIVIPARHPLLSRKLIPLAEALTFPLILYRPEAYEGFHGQLDRLLQSTAIQPNVATRVTTFNSMLAFVSGGYGLGFSSEPLITAFNYPEVVPRALADESARMTTYFLRPAEQASPELERFMARAYDITSNA